MASNCLCSTEPPTWFNKFFQGKMIEIMEILKKQASVLESLTTRVEALEKESTIRDGQSNSVVENVITELESVSACVDQCEVILSGLPSSLTLSSCEIAKKVAEAIDLPSVLPHIIETRKWKPPSTLRDPSKLSSNQKTQAIVFKLSSPTIRDQLASKSYKLGRKSVNKIFNSGGEGHLSLSPLWPKSTYEIFKEACNKSRELSYAKPIVRNLRVFMRETSKSAPVLIRSKQDLKMLKLGHKPPPVY